MKKAQMDMAGKKKRTDAGKAGFLSWFGRAAARRSSHAQNKRDPKSKAQPAPLADPTRGFFAAGDSDRRGGHLPLAAELMDAAERVAQTPKEITAAKNRLIAGLGARAEGEVMLAIQAFRVLIGVAWLGVGAWLYNSGLVAAAANMPTLANGMPVGDAMVLSRMFFIVAAAGLAAALFLWFLAKASGNGDNNRVRGLAENLGREIAYKAQDFQGQLNNIYDSFSTRGAPRDAISEISRAHIVALEACYLLQAYGFIADHEGDKAQDDFEAFLRPKPAHPSVMGVFVGGLVLGLIVGAGYIWVNFVPQAEPTSAPSTPLAIAQYPWAYYLLLLGAAVYAMAGFFVSAASGVIAGGALSAAREDALDSLRSAYTETGAPRRVDLADQIRRLSDVFAASIQWRPNAGGTSHEPKTNQPDAETADFGAGAPETPAWRRPDSGASFVETGFQAAPQSWRVDAGAQLRDGEPGSKRGFGKLKKR